MRHVEGATHRAAMNDELVYMSLTKAQHLIWLGQELNADAPLYNMVHTFEINGALDFDHFEVALASLIDDSDALRTTFCVVDGEPRQVVHRALRIQLESVDLSGRDGPAEAAQQWIDVRRVRLLDLGEQAFDTALLKLADNSFIWYWCHHHIIADAQAFDLTFRYLADRYELALAGRLGEAAKPPQYRDYIEFEAAFTQSGPFRKARDHWAHVAGESMPVPTLYGKVAGNHGARARRVVLNLDSARSQALRKRCGDEPFRLLSPQLSLHALWATLAFVTIHRITGDRRIRFGTPFQARPTPAFKQTIGLFIEIGALSIELDEQDTFNGAHAKVVQELLTGLRNARPGTSSAALNRSYSILFNYVTARFGSFAGLPSTTQWIHAGHGDAQHYLRIQVTDFEDDGEFAVHLDLHEAQFDEARESWLKMQLMAVVDAFLDEPTQGIGGFGLSSPEQLRHLVHDFNATEKNYGRGGTVLALLAEAVRERPDAIAVRQGETRFSYAQLDTLSEELAQTLNRAGAGPGARVGLCVPRSLEAVAAIWGVLKAGAAFVPVDLNLPSVRIAELLEDLSPAAIVSLPGEDGLPATPPGCAIIPFDRQFRADEDRQRTMPEVGAATPAYLIYTSGSTGMPKAAVLGHEGLNNYVQWACETYRSEGSMDFAFHSSLSFDLTLTSIFVPAATGSTVVVYPEQAHEGGLEILDVFADGEVDMVKLTPAHLELLRETDFSKGSIKTLIVGGEDFKTGLANAIQSNGPAGLRIFNEYGPTEATIGCMVHRFDAAIDTGASVPIGVPAANMQVVVADPYGHPAPPGVIGEMLVSGPGVALSYWNRPELNEACFSTSGTLRTYRTGDLARWTEDGLAFLGRRDDQIKHNGFRIELGEIEAALAAIPGMQSVAVKITGKSEADPADPTFCVACGISSRTPGSDLDDQGVCKDCRDYEVLSGQVERYFNAPEDLREVLRQAKPSERGGYDCVVLTSGGKDSTYMLYQMVREFGVRPMVFTLDNGYLSERAISNVNQACEDLGVDLEVGSTPHMGAIFADSLRRHCNVCNGCFKTIYTLSMSLARRIGVSTIVTGLSRGQLFETRLSDTFRARQFDPAQIDRMVTDARKVYHHVDDAVYRLLDTELFEDERIFDEIRFIDFYRYVDVPLSEVYEYLEGQTVWQRPEDTGRSTNCLINDAGIYVHNRVRGYHNYALPYSWDVRLGHKERLVAMEELDDEIDQNRVKQILQEIGYEEPPMQTRDAGALTAYYVGESELSHTAIRSRLQERLPQHMIPSTFVRMDVMPLTANGKVDRTALPAPGGGRSQLDTAYVRPASAVEKALAEIWTRVIDVEPIGVEDNFFAIGGDSVMSIQIAAQAAQAGLNMTPRMLFLYPTIATLARHIGKPLRAPAAIGAFSSAQLLSADDRQQLVSLVGEQEFASWEDVFPLSPTQAGMLYQTLASEEPGVYIGQAKWVLRGEVNLAKLQEAYAKLVERHAVLRTRVLWEGLSEPVQAINQPGHCAVEALDWRTMSASELEEQFKLLWQSNWDVGFDLGAGPPIKLTLVVAPDDKVFVLWSTHHLLFDGWSATPLFSEWLTLYDGLLTGELPQLEKPVPYADFIRWQRSQDPSAALDFWRTRLEGLEAGTQLPVGQLSRGSTSRRSHHSVVLDRACSRSLRQLASSCRVTLNALFQTAWGLLLSRYCRQSDVVFGATFSGRNGGLAGVDRMIGLFINTLPVRMDIDENASLESWLAQVQANLLAAIEYEHAPLAKVQRMTQLDPAEILFDSILVFENFPELIESVCPNLTAEQPRFTTPSHFPLAILVYPDDQLKFELIYDPGSFSNGDVVRLGQHLTNLLESMIQGRTAPVGELSILAPGELQELDSGQGELREISTGLLRQIEAQAVANADAVAVESQTGNATYGELLGRANGIAKALQDAGVKPGDMVGVETSRTPETVAGLLAVWKAGAAFVPLDHNQPAHRIKTICDNANVEVVIAASASSFPTGYHIVRPQEVHTADIGPNVSLDADDLAYVLYTSGSTGVPKGVMVTHGNIATSTQARIELYPGHVSQFLHLSPLAFDSAMAGLWWTLLDGGSVLFASDEQAQDAALLAELIASRSVSHLLTLPRFYEVILDAAQPHQLGSLEVAIVAGEVCPAALPARHYAACKKATLYNEYGPTEATVWSHVFAVPRGFNQSAVPIGNCIPGMNQTVVDHRCRPVPSGVPGELLLSGPGIAAGYLEQSELAAQRFFRLDSLPGKPRVYRTGDLVKRNPDGQLDYLGRIDQQLKIRGFRVEPGEVEAALVTFESIQDAVVTTVQQAGTQRIRLLASFQAAASVDETELKSYLANRIPAFMLPDYYQQVDVLPRLSNGKVDVRSLGSGFEETQTGGAAHRPPRTGVERQVARIWSKLLKLETVGLDDNFVESGGDSIVALQVVSRARAAGIRLNPGDLIRSTNLRELCATAGEASQRLASAVNVDIPAPLSPIESWFFELPNPDPGHWNMTGAMRLKSDIDLARLTQSLRLLLERHACLRTRYLRHKGTWQREQPAAVDDGFAIEQLRLEGIAPDLDDPQLAGQLKSLQQTLDIGRGVLFKPVLLQFDHARWLVLVVHHLTMDGVSWTVLLEEMVELYLAGNRREVLPGLELPFNSWAHWLKRKTQDGHFDSELDYWRQQPWHKARPLVSQKQRLDNTEAKVVRFVSTGATESLTSIQTQAPRSGVTVEICLLAAVCRSLFDRASPAPLIVGLEGHGRNGLGEGLDPVSSLGWFTAQFPMLVDLQAGADAEGDLKLVKEARQSIPSGGTGFGALRYLHPQEQVRSQLAEIPIPDVLFNYLGNTERAAGTALFSEFRAPIAASRSKDAGRPAVLELNVAIRDGLLQCVWSYNEEIHSKAVITTYDRAFEAALGQIASFLESRSLGATPSDFPLADLSQDELDDLLDEL